jgi:hypothetical protein
MGVLLLLAVACTGGGDSGPSGAPPADVPSAEDAISGFDASQPALSRSIAAVAESAEADPGAMRDAALAALDATEPTRRFAAVFALSLTASTDVPESLDALRDLAASSDVTERLLAAGTLAALGEHDGVEALIDALSSDEPLRNVDPPMTAWRFGRANLLLLVGQDLGLRDAVDLASATAAQAAWRTWWTENAAALTWNAETGRYEGAGVP